MDTTNLTVTATVDDTLMPNPTNPRGRGVKARRVHVGRIEATDRSLTAAKAEATRQLQNWIEAANESPKVIRWQHRDLCAVLTAMPNSGETGIAVHMVVSGIGHNGSFVCWDSTGRHDHWREAEAYARKRMTDAACDPLDDASVATAVRYLQSYPNGEDAAREVLRSAGWQRAWRHAESIGETDPHRWACDHDREFIPSVTTP